MRNHRGALRVQSAPGRGTAISVFFPIATEQMDLTLAEEEKPVTAWVGRGTVLAVDDEAFILSLLKSFLSRQGFNVLTAKNGREALEVFREHADEIRLVLVDLTMPEMDGVEVYRTIARKHPEMPVLMLSGYAEADALSRLSDSDIAGFLQKPFEAGTLMTKVREILKDP